MSARTAGDEESRLRFGERIREVIRYGIHEMGSPEGLDGIPGEDE